MSIITSPTDLPYVVLNPPALSLLILPSFPPLDKDELKSIDSIYSEQMHCNHWKKKFRYKRNARIPGKLGKRLLAKYKRMFANKQIVCIKHMSSVRMMSGRLSGVP